MIASICIATLTIVALFVTILFKPYAKVGKTTVGLYWVVCLVGALLQLVFGTISLQSVWAGVTADTSVNPLKILTLFISMTLISIYLGETGFFHWVAQKIFLKAKASKMQMFLALYFAVALLTVFTSNDVIILTFTPPICIFAKSKKISPLPFLFGEFVAANTFSLFLVVGNPTNVYLATSYGITFFDYFCKMILPAVACGVGALLATMLVFGKQLRGNLLDSHELLQQEENQQVSVQKTPMIVALVHLGACILLLAINDVIGVEMYLICAVLCLSLTIFNVIYQLATKGSCKQTLVALGKAPLELIPFVLSMFVLVLSLSYNGVTTAMGKWLVTNTKWDGVTFGVLSTVSSNLLNNISMSVLFEKIIDGNSLYAVLGSVIGSNVGALLTPMGALAGIMWNRIIGQYGEKISFEKFSKYGVAIVCVALAFSLGALCLA